MGIRQMSDVKEQFQISRVAVFVTKAQNLHPHRATLAVETEPLKKQIAECVNCMFGSIDYLVGDGAYA